MKMFIIAVLGLLCTSCTMVNVDLNRSYCPHYRNSLGADIRIITQNGSSLHIPVSCVRID